MDSDTQTFLQQSVTGLDLTTLAAASNLITGGRLREADVKQVILLAAKTAYEKAGQVVILAGIRARYVDGQMILGLSGDIESLEM